ncbi:MAG: transporter substrate-binding domain-containing protein, partial [Actinomycetota bacterium]|nr:transporter substrate-binding domain-containing protein [Actinomycetota bacterium]
YSGIIGVLTCDDFGDCGSQRISVIQHNDSSDWQAGTANVVFTYNPASSAQVGDIAAAAVGLAAVCPSPLVIQTDWFPEAEHGAMYELLGDGYTIDADNMVVSGPGQVSGNPLGIDIEVRTGGPAIGWSPVSSHVYTDDSIHLGYRSTDQQILEFADAPMLSVVAPLEKNPQMIMWDPDTYPDVRTLADLGEQGIVINIFGGGTFSHVFAAEGIWSEDQIDPSYDGSPAVFIASGGEVAQQGFASAEPHQYEHVYEEWGKPVRFQLLNDAGFVNYSQTLAIRSADLESLRPCLELFVPVVQQAVVDYDASPDRANAIIVDAVVTFDSFWSYDMDLAAFSHATQRNLGLIGNGPDSTVGNMEPSRIQTLIDKIAAVGLAPDGLTVDDLMTNEFIDMSIGFPEGAGPTVLPDLGGRVISIAVDNAYLPFSYIPADTGVAEGWDYDAMDEICFRLNCVPDFQEFVWDGTIIATGEGQFDMAAGGITITEERDEVVDFSDSFISTDQKILVAKDNADIGSRADLEAADCNVGSMTGTTNYDLSAKIVGEARIVAFESFAFAVQSLITGDVCAVIMDDVAGQGYQGENADQVSMIDEVLQADPLGFAFTEGSDLVAPFNEAIASMKADGTLAALNGKYFGTAFTITYDDIGDGAYAAPPLTASWRGVTESEIHIGVSMLDFAFLVDTNLSPQGWGDQQLVWETLVANLNANGGVLGRELVVDAYRYYSPIGPILGGIDPEGVCLELTADHETFAVIGGFLGPVEDVNTCITGPQNTVLVGGRQTVERLAQSDAPWLESAASKETRMRVFLSLLNAEGMLDDKKIALVGNRDDGPYDLASELLGGMDVDVVLDVALDVAVGDVEAEDARWDVLVENVLASGADVAMLVGGERAGIRNLWHNDIDVDLYVMNSETFTSLSESVTPEMADGGLSLTGLTDSEIWSDPATQSECAAPFADANPDIVVVGPDAWVEGEEQWFRSIMSYCRWLKLFTMVAEAAGPDLTHESFLAAAESMNEFTLPGQPYNSLGPGKYDAGDSFRLAVFDADTGGADGALVPMSDVMDGTP